MKEYEFDEKKYCIARLCNNDYGYNLKRGIDILFHDYAKDVFNVTIEQVKLFIIGFILGQQLLKEAYDGKNLDQSSERIKSTERYLQEKLRVTFEQYAPREDHDGGSAAINLSSGYSWTF